MFILLATEHTELSGRVNPDAHFYTLDENNLHVNKEQTMVPACDLNGTHWMRLVKILHDDARV